MQAIREYWLANKHPPSLRDIVEMTGRKKTAIFFHIKKLRKDGELLPSEKWQNRALTPSDIQISFGGTDNDVYHG
jgi:hypothetical protein